MACQVTRNSVTNEIQAVAFPNGKDASFPLELISEHYSINKEHALKNFLRLFSKEHFYYKLDNLKDIFDKEGLRRLLDNLSLEELILSDEVSDSLKSIDYARTFLKGEVTDMWAAKAFDSLQDATNNNIPVEYREQIVSMLKNPDYTETGIAIAAGFSPNAEQALAYEAKLQEAYPEMGKRFPALDARFLFRNPSSVFEKEFDFLNQFKDNQDITIVDSAAKEYDQAKAIGLTKDEAQQVASNYSNTTKPIQSSKEDVRRIKAAKEALAHILGKDTPVTFGFGQMLDNIKHEGIPGGFVLDNMIYLDKSMKEEGIEFHEAFHYVFRSLMTDAQIKFYLDQAKKEMNLTPEQLREKKKQLLKEVSAYNSLNADQIEDLVYEEYLADAYQQYAINNEVPKTWLGAFVQFISDMIQKLLGNRTSIEALFSRINNRGFSFTKRKSNRFSMMKSIPVFKLLVVGEDIDLSGNTINDYAGESESNAIVRELAGLLYEKLSSGVPVRKGQHKKMLEGIMQERSVYYKQQIDNEALFDAIEADSDIERDLKEEELENKLKRKAALYNPKTKSVGEGITNGDLVWGEVKKLFSIFGDVLDTPMEFTDSDDAAAEVLEMGETSAWEKNPVEIRDQELKKFMGFILYKDKDPITGEMRDTPIDANVVFDGLLKYMSSRELHGANFLDLMKAYSKYNPMTRAFYARLVEEATDANGNLNHDHNLVNLVRKSLDNMRMDSIMLLFDPNTRQFKVINSATKDTTGTQMEQWAANWNDRRIANFLMGARTDLRFARDISASFAKLKNTFGDKDAIVAAINSLNSNNSVIDLLMNGKKTNRGQIYTLEEMAGIKLSPGYLHYSLLAAYENMQKHNLEKPTLSQLMAQGIISREDFLAYKSNVNEGIEPLTADQIDNINKVVMSKPSNVDDEIDAAIVKATGVDDYHNPFEDLAKVNNEEGKEIFHGGIRSIIRKISKGNTYFDETLVSTSFQDAAGNDRYGFVKKSQILVFINRLKDPNYRKGLIRDYPWLAENYFFKPGVFSEKTLDNIFKALKFKLIGDVRQTKITDIQDAEGKRVGSVGESTTEEGAGATSKNIDFAAFEILKLSLFARRDPLSVTDESGTHAGTIYTANFYPSVNETKKTDVSVSLPIGGFDLEKQERINYTNSNGTFSKAGIDVVYSQFQNELNRVLEIEQEILDGLRAYDAFYEGRPDAKELAAMHREMIEKRHDLIQYKEMLAGKQPTIQSKEELTDLIEALETELITLRNYFSAKPTNKLYEGFHVKTSDSGKIEEKYNKKTGAFEGYEFGRGKDLWNFKALLDIVPELKTFMEERSELLLLNTIPIQGYETTLEDGTIVRTKELTEAQMERKRVLDAKHRNALRNRINAIGNSVPHALFPDSTRHSIREGLTTYLNDQLKTYKADLASYGVLELTSDGKIQSKEGTHKLPDMPSEVVAGNSYKTYTIDGNTNLDWFMADFFINSYINASAFNELIDKNAAYAKDPIDRVKRNGGKVAFGDGAGSGLSRFAYIKEPIAYTKFGPKVDRADAQSQLSLEGYEFLLKRWGRYPESKEHLFDKIRWGLEDLTWDEIKELEKANIILNSKKTMLYDSEVYHKLSYQILTRQYTSILPESSRDEAKTLRDQIMAIEKELEALEPGTQEARDLHEKLEVYKAEYEYLWWPNPMHVELHNMRRNMMFNKIVGVLPESASKLRRPIAATEVDGHFDFAYSAEDLANENWRLQMETPSGKSKIVTPSQVLNLIDNEIIDLYEDYKLQGKDYTMQQVKDKYHKLLGERVEVAMNSAMQQLGEIDGAGFLKSLDMEKFRIKLYQTLIESGADDSLLNFFRESANGGKEMKYNANLPAISGKFQQLFLAHFSKGVLQAKVPGRKVSLISDWGNEVVVDANDNIIPRAELTANITEYMNEDGSLKEGYTRRPLKWSSGYATQTTASINGQDISTNYTPAELKEWLVDDNGEVVDFIKRRYNIKSISQLDALSDDILANLFVAITDYNAYTYHSDVVSEDFNSKDRSAMTEENFRAYETAIFNRQPGLYQAKNDFLENFVPFNDGDFNNMEEFKIFLSLIDGDLIGDNVQQTLSEVLITPWDAFTHGLSIGDEFDKNHPAYKSIMEQFGTRIPTQDLHSMLVFKVAGFLPSYMGDVAVLPKETVLLSGEDFDIDAKYLKRKDYYIQTIGNGDDKVKVIRIHGEMHDPQVWEQRRKDFIDRYNLRVAEGKIEGPELVYNEGDGVKQYHFDNLVHYTKEHNKSVKYDYKKLLENDKQYNKYLAEYNDVRLKTKYGTEIYELIMDKLEKFEQLDEVRQKADDQIFYLNMILTLSRSEIKAAKLDLVAAKKANDIKEVKRLEKLIAEKSPVVDKTQEQYQSAKAEAVRAEQQMGTLQKEIGRLAKDTEDKKLILKKRKLRHKMQRRENKLFLDAMHKNGLPTSFENYTEDFHADDTSGVKNTSSLSNWLLDIEKALYLNAGSVDITYTPASMTKIQGDRDAADADIRAGIGAIVNEILGQTIGKYEYNTPTGQMTAKVANKTGDALIGPAAIANIVKATLAKSGILLKENERSYSSLMFDGTDYNSFAGYNAKDIRFEKVNGEWRVMVDSEGNQVTKSYRIMDELSTILSAMTDNAKHNDAAKLNFTLETLPAYLYMVSLGMGLNRTVLMSKSPVMQLYNQLSAQKRGAFQNRADLNKTKNTVNEITKQFTDVQETLMERMKSLAKEMQTNGVPDSDSLDAEYFERLANEGEPAHNNFIELDSQAMLDDMALSNEMKERFEGRDFTSHFMGDIAEELNFDEARKVYMALKRQMDVLNGYNRMAGQSGLFQAVSPIIRLHQGLKPTFFEQQKVYDSIRKFGIDLEALAEGKDNYTIEGYDAATAGNAFELLPVLEQSPDLRDLLVNFKKVMDASEFLFIEQSDIMINLFQTMGETLGSIKNRNDVLKSVRGQMMGFTIVRTMQEKARREGQPNPFDDSLIYAHSENTIFDRLQHLLDEAKKNNDSTIADNLFIKALRRIENKRTEGDFNEYGTYGFDVFMDELIVNTRTKNTSDYNNRVINAFKELMYKQIIDGEGNKVEDPKRPGVGIVNAFAQDLFGYLIVKDGLQYKNGSFLKYVAPEMYTEMSEVLKEVTKAFRGNQWGTTKESLGLTALLGFENQAQLKDQFIKMFGLNPKNAELFKDFTVDREAMTTINTDVQEELGVGNKVVRKFDLNENGEQVEISEASSVLPDFIEFDISQIRTAMYGRVNNMIRDYLNGKTTDNEDGTNNEQTERAMKYFKVQGIRSMPMFYSEFKRLNPTSKISNEKEYQTKLDSAKAFFEQKIKIGKSGSDLGAATAFAAGKIQAATNGAVAYDSGLLALPKFISMNSTETWTDENTGERHRVTTRKQYMLINVSEAPTDSDGNSLPEDTLLRRSRGVYVKVEPIKTVLYPYLYDANQFREVILKNLRIREEQIKKEVGSIGYKSSTEKVAIDSIREELLKQKFSYNLYSGSFSAALAAESAALTPEQMTDDLFLADLNQLYPKFMNYDEWAALSAADDYMNDEDIVLFKKEIDNIETGKQRMVIVPDEAVDKTKLQAGESGIITLNGRQYIVQNIGRVSLETLVSKLSSKVSDPNKRGADVLKEFYPLEEVAEQQADDFLTYNTDSNSLDIKQSNAQSPKGKVVYLIEPYKHSNYLSYEKRNNYGMHSITLVGQDKTVDSYGKRLKSVQNHQMDNTEENIKQAVEESDFIISFGYNIQDVVDPYNKETSTKRYFNVKSLNDSSMAALKEALALHGAKNVAVVTGNKEGGATDYSAFLRKVFNTSKALPIKQTVKSPKVSELAQLLMKQNYRFTPTEILAAGRINIPANALSDEVKKFVRQNYNEIKDEIYMHKYNVQLTLFDTKQDPYKVADKHPVEQNFYDGKAYKNEDGEWSKYQSTRPGITSIEMIREGIRTSTTRSSNQLDIVKKIAAAQSMPVGTITGTVLYMKDASGKSNKPSSTAGQGVYVRITSEIIPFGTPEFESNWKANEGWNPQSYEDLSSKYKEGWGSFTYEYVSDAEAESQTPVFDTLPMKSEKPTMTYAGIGSRKLSDPKVAKKMKQLAARLESIGFTLRSGAAKGPDSHFEAGVKNAANKEIFPGSKKAGEKELKIAEEIHPAWNALVGGTQANAIKKGKDPKKSVDYVTNLMARNTNQIFGQNLDTPVDFVLAWTEDGVEHHDDRTRTTGGTGQAISMASLKGIPVINMANANWETKIAEVIKDIQMKKETQTKAEIEKELEERNQCKGQKKSNKQKAMDDKLSDPNFGDHLRPY
jgi:hypothetical protein